MTMSLSAARYRWSIGVLVVACGLAGILAVQPARAAVPVLGEMRDDALEGDPGDGVLAPQGAGPDGSGYVGHDGPYLPYGYPMGLVLVVPGLYSPPPGPLDPAWPSRLWSRRPVHPGGSRRCAPFDSRRLIDGEAWHVPDGRGCRHAP